MRRIESAMAGAALAMVGASAAWAQEPPVPSERAIARACATDVERFCPGVPPGGGRIKACMKANASHLSAGCFDALLGAVTLMYTVNSDLAFPPGGWQLSEAGKALFAKLVHKLAPTQDNRIYVSGFTDSTPIGPELMARGITSNQQLSQMRADNVMQYLISQGVKPDMISAKGFGDADPVATNATVEGRAKNRRVELSLYPLQIAQP
jgi:outer membrane protein OmpA-like peptidoglycan-associated protein